MLTRVKGFFIVAGASYCCAQYLRPAYSWQIHNCKHNKAKATCNISMYSYLYTYIYLHISRSDTDDQYGNTSLNGNNSFHCNKTVPWDCLPSSTSAYIYMAFLGLAFLFGLIRSWTLFTLGVRSSKSLHNNLYKAVVRAPIRFHDTNTKGIILIFCVWFHF